MCLLCSEDSEEEESCNSRTSKKLLSEKAKAQNTVSSSATNIQQKKPRASTIEMMASRNKLIGPASSQHARHSQYFTHLDEDLASCQNSKEDKENESPLIATGRRYSTISERDSYSDLRNTNSPSPPATPARATESWQMDCHSDNVSDRMNIDEKASLAQGSSSQSNRESISRENTESVRSNNVVGKRFATLPLTQVKFFASSFKCFYDASTSQEFWSAISTRIDEALLFLVKPSYRIILIWYIIIFKVVLKNIWMWVHMDNTYMESSSYLSSKYWLQPWWPFSALQATEQSALMPLLWAFRLYSERQLCRPVKLAGCCIQHILKRFCSLFRQIMCIR